MRAACATHRRITNVRRVVASDVAHDVNGPGRGLGEYITECGRVVATQGPTRWSTARAMVGLCLEAGLPAGGMCPVCLVVAEESAHRTVISRNITTGHDVAPGEFSRGALRTYDGSHADLRGLVRTDAYGGLCEDCEDVRAPQDGVCVAARTEDGWAILHRVRHSHLSR